MEAPASKATKHYRVQLCCHFLILLLVMASLVVLHVSRVQFLPYVLIACIGVVVVCIFSTLVQPPHIKSGHRIKFWRKLVQWLGFLAALYIDLLTLKHGMASATNAGIFALILLAATLFFIGTIDNFPMALLGITIAIMVGGTIILPTYLLSLVGVMAVIMGLVIFWLIRRNYRQVEAIE